jgi:hypothetical protein
VKGRAPLPGSGTTAARRAGRKAAWRTALAGTTALAALLLATPVQAQDSDLTNLFGSRGLIGTPSARMAPDGELAVGASFLKNNQHYNFSFEVLPWLEATFRYSGLQNFEPGYPVYYDRAFGAKARLWDEGDVMPAIAVGIDDIVGTGIYSGEYIIASKRFGDVDTSLGFGWGRHAGTKTLRNPLGLIARSFDTRQSFFGQAGGADFKAFFHGRNIGVFGGAVWHTPLEGLSLIAEYDSDNYSQEKAAGNFLPKNQFNYGVAYNLTDAASVGLYWLYGTTVGGNFSMRLDPVHPQYPQKIETPPPPVTQRSPEQQRQALAALLGQRDPSNAVQTRLLDTRNADRNDFVDALWQQGSDYADIQVRQNMLDLTVTGTISSTRCAAAARLMQGVATHISRVRLHDLEAKRSVSCVVPRSVEGAFASAAFLSTGDLKVLALPVVHTIDATDVTSQPNRKQAMRNIRKALTEQRLAVEALSLGDGELIVYYRNSHYLSESDAIDRMVRVLTKEAPPQVEKFRLIAVYGGIPQQEFDVLRGPVERSASQNEGDIFDNSVSLTLPPIDNPVLMAAARKSYPRFSWGIFPQMRQALFDPNQPFGVQFLGALSAGLEVTPGLTLSGSLEVSVYDNFDTSRTSDSQLQHVRSDFLKYFTRGKTGIGHLQSDYRFRLSPTVFVTGRAGYLESEFAGAGGEILWRPEGARWALGADAYQVWQRDFDRLLGLQHYHVTTGHVTLYYDSPWYSLNFQLRAGKYLAGDHGVTFQVTRRFSTGVEIGAFITKTNVSASQFGEGSFDKGIIIRLPLGWIAPLETQSQIVMDLRPVQRDGGQVLTGDATLYEEARPTSQGELLRQQSGFLGPQ